MNRYCYNNNYQICIVSFFFLPFQKKIKMYSFKLRVCFYAERKFKNYFNAYSKAKKTHFSRIQKISFSYQKLSKAYTKKGFVFLHITFSSLIIKVD